MMASNRPSPLHNLPSVDPAMSRVGNALLRLLAHHDFDIALLNKAPDYAHVFQTENGCAFTTESALPDKENVDALCDLLDRLDPLLSHAEAHLKLILDAEEIAPLSQSAFVDRQASLISVCHKGETLLLALPHDDEWTKSWVTAAAEKPINLSAITVPIRLEAIAARLALSDAAAINGGDMLLLHETLMASLSLPNGDTQQGLWNSKNGEWRAGSFADLEDDMVDEDASANADANDIADAAPVFTVPVTLKLPDQAMDAATLSSLAPGAILSLMPMIEGLQVDLLVGGRRIARGEIVQLGENFAVHIDEHFATPTAPAPTLLDEEEED
jgi:flagellar motor switch/type III secretory pathway protein FliN